MYLLFGWSYALLLVIFCSVNWKLCLNCIVQKKKKIWLHISKSEILNSGLINLFLVVCYRRYQFEKRIFHTIQNWFYTNLSQWLHQNLFAPNFANLSTTDSIVYGILFIIFSGVLCSLIFSSGLLNYSNCSRSDCAKRYPFQKWM